MGNSSLLTKPERRCPDQGKKLANHSIIHTIDVLVNMKTINPASVTFDTKNIKAIEFLPEWRGKKLADATPDQLNMFLILANGNHRVELMRRYAYKDQLKAFNDVSAKLSAWQSSGKNAKSAGPLEIEVEQRRSALREVTWVARILDMGASLDRSCIVHKDSFFPLEKINAHPDAVLIQTEIASNKIVHQVEETSQNTLTMFFDALNEQLDQSVETINAILSLLVNTAEAKSKHIVKRLSSPDMVQAYA